MYVLGVVVAAVAARDIIVIILAKAAKQENLMTKLHYSPSKLSLSTTIRAALFIFIAERECYLCARYLHAVDSRRASLKRRGRSETNILCNRAGSSSHNFLFIRAFGLQVNYKYLIIMIKATIQAQLSQRRRRRRKIDK